jgi:hypothetical protein
MTAISYRFKNDKELAVVKDAVVGAVILQCGSRGDGLTPRPPQHAMVERAIRLEGTCTGEHGVGMGKVVCRARSDRPSHHRPHDGDLTGIPE